MQMSLGTAMHLSEGHNKLVRYMTNLSVIFQGSVMFEAAFLILVISHFPPSLNVCSLWYLHLYL